MSATELGEYAVGAWLQEVAGCDYINYNVRPPGGGLKSLSEFDVVGLHFHDKAAYLCEVGTHLDGLNYGSYAKTIKKISTKYEGQKNYARLNLSNFEQHNFMLWSPRVPVGKMTDALATLSGLKLVINNDYTEKIGELRRLARKSTRDTGNPFFRSLQILEHLRK